MADHTRSPVEKRPQQRALGRQATPDDVVQLKVTIQATKPPVWRRVQVPASHSLARLHDVLQAAFGWWNSHLHEFEIEGRRIGMADLEDFEDPPADEHAYLVCEFAREGARFTYLYDFGDHWEHRIEVENILTPEPGTSYPRVVAGRRACPPEDCGGTHGFAELLDAIADPGHEEHESLLEWLGGSYDPKNAALDGFSGRLLELQRAATEP